MGKITATDRLIFTLLFSIIIHLTIVLGVSFDASSPPTNSPLVNLEITLVKQQTQEAPEQADFLAQANNEGGGETEQKEPEPTPEVTNVAEVEQTQVIPIATPEPEPVQPAPEPMPTPPEPEIPPAPPKPVEKVAATQKVITQKTAERKVEQQIDIAEKPEPQKIETPPKPKLSARDLMAQTRNEIARLEAKFDANKEALSKRPKSRRISAATKEYAAAAYMKSWESKVERIGNYNYPQEAKRQGINGSLMLSVDINPDGSVPPDGIVISRSSGHKILDDAAVRIVRLGAPYAAIPDDVLRDNDMLTIIRTWKFETNQGLSTR